MTISKMLLVVLPSVIILTAVMLGVEIFLCCHYAECRKAECHYAECLDYTKNNFVYLFNAALYYL